MIVGNATPTIVPSRMIIPKPRARTHRAPHLCFGCTAGSSVESSAPFREDEESAEEFINSHYRPVPAFSRALRLRWGRCAF